MSIYAFEGERPIIAPTAFTHESAQIIGNVVIGENCFVGAGAIIGADYGTIRIGDRVAVEEGCHIHVAPGETCHICSDVILGHGAIVHCAEIQSNVRLGMGAIVSLGSVVEEWAVIGDGAVVPPNQKVTSGRVFLGNPAKDVRGVSSQEKEGTTWGIKLYADLCDRYRASLDHLSP